MNRSGLLLGVASVLAGTAVLMAVLGVAYNLVFVGVALPFGAAAYLLWFDATGGLAERVRRRGRRAREARRERPSGGRARADGARRTRADGARRTRAGRERREPPTAEGPSREEARRILGVDGDADGAAIRAAYREAVKDAHPDAEGGGEEQFKRVRAAYERLRE